MSFAPIIGLRPEVPEQAAPAHAVVLKNALEAVFGPIELRTKRGLQGQVVPVVGCKPRS